MASLRENRSTDGPENFLGKLQQTYLQRLFRVISKRENSLSELKFLADSDQLEVLLDGDLVMIPFAEYEFWLHELCYSDLPLSSASSSTHSDDSDDSMEDPTRTDELMEVAQAHIEAFVETNIRALKAEKIEKKLSEKWNGIERWYPAASKLLEDEYRETTQELREKGFDSIINNDSRITTRQNNVCRYLLESNPVFRSWRNPSEPAMHHQPRMTEWYRSATELLLKEGIFPGVSDYSCQWRLVRICQLWNAFHYESDRHQEHCLDLIGAREKFIRLTQTSNDIQICLRNDNILEAPTVGFIQQVGYHMLRIHEEEENLKAVEAELTEIIPQMIMFSKEASSLLP